MALKLIEDYITLGLSVLNKKMVVIAMYPLGQDSTIDKMGEIAQNVSSMRSHLHITQFIELLKHESKHISSFAAQHILQFFDPEVYPTDKAIEILEDSPLKYHENIIQLIKNHKAVKTDRLLQRSKIFGNKISARIFAIRYNLREVNRAYEASTRDAFLDAGLEYNKEYKDDVWYRQKEFEYQMLQRVRNLELFTAILNFTQSFYSLKDYLKKSFPQFKNKIEEFFSRENNSMKSRKSISNDLKHNPKNDVEYRFEKTGHETVHTPGKILSTTYMKHSWFYGNNESVEHCSLLFSDLLSFLNELANEINGQPTI